MNKEWLNRVRQRWARTPRSWAKMPRSWDELTGRSWVSKGGLIVLAVVLLAVPQVIASNYWIRIFGQAGLYIMMALGLNVILGYAGLLNLGYAAFFAIGAYTWALLASPQFDLHWPFLLVLPLAGLLAGLASYLLAIPGLGLKGDYLALVTIGFAETIRILANNASFTNAAAGIIQIDHPSLGFLTLESVQHYYYVLVGLCAIEVFLMKRLENSRIGMAWMAIREDQLAAETMGLDARKLKLLACFIGGIPAGLAGVLFAGMQTFISPVSFKFLESITILSMVVVGGSGNVAGVVLGAILLTVLPEPLRGSTFDSARILLYGLLLVFMALFRPQGVWPRRYGGVKSGEEAEKKGDSK